MPQHLLFIKILIEHEAPISQVVVWYLMFSPSDFEWNPKHPPFYVFPLSVRGVGRGTNWSTIGPQIHAFLFMLTHTCVHPRHIQTHLDNPTSILIQWCTPTYVYHLSLCILARIHTHSRMPNYTCTPRKTYLFIQDTHRGILMGYVGLWKNR